MPSKSGAGDDSLFEDGRGIDQVAARKSKQEDDRRGGGKVERFGAGMERGGGDKDGDHGRTGRTKRRTNIRSGSRNTFRKM